MAKAIFEDNSPQVSIDEASLQREGNFDPNRPNTGNKASESVHLSGGRALYWEDLSRAEQVRLQTKFNQHIDSGLANRAQKSGKLGQQIAATDFRHPGDVSSGWRVPVQSLGKVAPGPETLSAVQHTYGRTEETVDSMADRISSTFDDMSSRSDLRMPGEEDQRAPGLEWYFDHNTHYATQHMDAPHASTIGSVMSPNNDPDNEKIATKGLLAIKDAPTYISRNTAKYLVKKTGVEVPSEQIGNTVSASALHPTHISALIRDDAPSAPTSKWPSGAKDQIRLSGTNASQGAAAAFQFDFDKESPGAIREFINPQSAPKVWHYAVANQNFVEDGRDMFSHRANNPGRAYVKDGRISMGVFEMTPEIAQDVLRIQYGHGTPEFDPQDRAVKEIQANIGRMVNPDNLHPATVQALTHPTIRSRSPHVSNLALASSNHPIVADSWMNAATAGQPQATVIPTDSDGRPSYRRPGRVETATSIFKTGGEYFDNMSIENKKAPKGREKILDSSPAGSKIAARSLQHALEDKAVRMSAASTGEPAVGKQAGTWTLIRRYSGKDPVYNRVSR